MGNAPSHAGGGRGGRGGYRAADDLWGCIDPIAQPLERGAEDPSQDDFFGLGTICGAKSEMNGLREHVEVRTPKKASSNASSRNPSEVSDFGFARRHGEKRRQTRPEALVLPERAAKAASAGDLVELRRMVADGTVPHVDVYDEKGRTLLHLAVMHGNLAMVQFLCTHRADVLRNSADGSSPLAVAEECNRPTVARFLGLWAHVTTCCPATALHLCALQGNTIEMMDILRSRRVEIDYEETYGHHTALHLAVKGGQVECVKVLVLAGADPNRRHPVSAESALVSAVIQNDAHLVGFLLSEGAISQTQYAGKILLQWAIENKRSSTIRTLLNDYQPEVQTPPGALHGDAEASYPQDSKKMASPSPLGDRGRAYKQSPRPLPDHPTESRVENRQTEAAERVYGEGRTAADRTEKGNGETPRFGAVVVRGTCGVCREDVKTNQQRILEQGFYFHQDCYQNKDRRGDYAREGGSLRPPDHEISDTQPLLTARGPTQRVTLEASFHQASWAGQQRSSGTGVRPKANDTNDESILDSIVGIDEDPLRERHDGLAKSRVEQESATLRAHVRPIEFPFVEPKSPEAASHQEYCADPAPLTPNDRAKSAGQLPRTLQVRTPGNGRRLPRDPPTSTGLAPQIGGVGVGPSSSENGWGGRAHETSLDNADTVLPQEGRKGAEGRGAAVTIDIPMSDYYQFRLRRQSESSSPATASSAPTAQEGQPDVGRGTDSAWPSGVVKAGDQKSGNDDEAKSNIKRVYLAEFDYEAVLDDELAFNAGDRMVVIGESDDAGWYESA